jgi:hypothetical protein
VRAGGPCARYSCGAGKPPTRAEGGPGRRPPAARPGVGNRAVGGFYGSCSGRGAVPGNPGAAPSRGPRITNRRCAHLYRAEQRTLSGGARSCSPRDASRTAGLDAGSWKQPALRRSSQSLAISGSQGASGRLHVPPRRGTRPLRSNAVSPRYFATMATPQLLGRDFDPRDTAASSKVAIVNERFANVFLRRAVSCWLAAQLQRRHL